MTHVDKRRPRRRAYGAATSRSRSLTLASCSRSRFVVAKAERPEGTQGMSTTEWRAKGERHGVTQAMSKSEGLAKGERHVSDSSHEPVGTTGERRGNVVTKP